MRALATSGVYLLKKRRGSLEGPTAEDRELPLYSLTGLIPAVPILEYIGSAAR